MTRSSALGVAATALALGAMTAAAESSKRDAVPTMADVADRIVDKTAHVREGEVIQLAGGPADLAFLEELAMAVRKRGAWPIITYWSETAEKKLLDTLVPKYDRKPNAADVAIAKVIDAQIWLPAIRDNTMYSKLAPERLTALSRANQTVSDALRRHHVRLIDLDNNLAPSPARARNAGISETDLHQMWWAGLAADYGALEERGKDLKERLAKGVEVRITHPNGTDLRFKVKGRKVFASDGMISDADIRAGGPAINVWLPAGEILLAPVSGTAEGKIVDDLMWAFDKEITGVTVEVKRGKITSINARAGWQLLQPLYEAAGPGKAEISGFDLGINPVIKNTGKLETFMAAGTVSVTTGDNRIFGGTNKEPFGLVFHLNGTTVAVDGKPLVEAGALK